MMLEAQSLAALSGIRHGFFTREGGVSTGIYASLNCGIGSNDDPANVSENRNRVAERMQVPPEHLLTLYQIHSADAVVADTRWPADARPRADAIVTKTPGLAIGATAADCGPVLFADVQARVIGAAHAGWKGALGGILEATIDAMERLGADRTRLCAAIGPTISQRNYEVGDDFRARFEAAAREHAQFFAPAARPGHAMFDLPGFIVFRLARAGVAAVEDLGVCTYADETRCFSYRRSVHRGEPDYGRHVHAIALMG